MKMSMGKLYIRPMKKINLKNESLSGYLEVNHFTEIKSLWKPISMKTIEFISSDSLYELII